MKKAIPILAFPLLSFSLHTKASAGNDPNSMVQPYYEKVGKAGSECFINNASAAYKSSVQSYDDMVKNTAEPYLRKRRIPCVWSTYDNV